jgi:hypothetical protein
MIVARTLFLAVLALSAVFAFVACDDDDNGDDAGTTPASGATTAATAPPALQTSDADEPTPEPVTEIPTTNACALRPGTDGATLQQGPSASLGGQAVRWQLCIGNAAAGSSEKMLFRSEDGGQTWTLISRTALGNPPPEAGVGELPSGTGVNVLLFLDAQDGWMGLASPGQNLWRTQDGGANWTSIDAVPPGVPITTISFTDSQNGAAVTPDSAWVTTDGGATWTEQP